MECRFNEETKAKEKNDTQKKELYSCDCCGKKYVKTSNICLCSECDAYLEAYIKQHSEQREEAIKTSVIPQEKMDAILRGEFMEVQNNV